MPDVSTLPPQDARSSEAVPPSSTTVKNRRLQYLRTHPEFLNDAPVDQRDPDEDRIGGPISANLLEAYDLDQRIAQRRQQAAKQEQEEEEEDSDSAASDEESSRRRQQVEDFLAGRTPGFDYTVVDEDSTLDDLVTMTRDEEERFFNEEDPQNGDDGEAEERDAEETAKQGETGVLDY